MIRIRPTTQITAALTVLGCGALLFCQLLWDVFPAPEQVEAGRRQTLGRNLAIQSLTLLEKGETQLLTSSYESVRKNDPGILSIGIRKANGELVAQTSDHPFNWPAQAAGRPDPAQLTVPISTAGQLWGNLEIRFVAKAHSALMSAMTHPLTIVLANFLLIGTLLFWVYLKRALVQLDPSSVIPERIRKAFDAMTEGIAVLDAQGRIVLANQAFHVLPPTPWPDLAGKRLSALPWLASGLSKDLSLHPWATVLKTGLPTTGDGVLIASASASPRHVVINCAPIADTQGHVKGCIVTFDDLSALHLANERLSATLAELNASRVEIQRKNLELEYTASHDSLSGCLTRRAGLARFEAALLAARNAADPLSCFILDIDHFKAVNDGFGHAMGDRVVKEVGGALLSSLRDTDIVARYGGDEFIIFMPHCDLSKGILVADSIRNAITRNCRTNIPELADFEITVSIGIAQWEAGEMTESAALMQAADAALYRAKSAGRNCVHSAHMQPTQSGSAQLH